MTEQGRALSRNWLVPVTDKFRELRNNCFIQVDIMQTRNRILEMALVLQSDLLT